MTTTTTATIGTLATAFQDIALSRLVPSAANVRKVNSTSGIGELADSIEAHGLIQNLTVRKAGKGQMRIPTKPAMHSNLKPAGSSDLKPATLGVIRMGRGDDVLRFVEGQAAG